MRIILHAPHRITLRDPFAPSSSPAPERPARRCPPLCTRHFGFRPVEDLEEFRDSVSHPGMHVCLGAFDVVVQIVSEELDSVDGREGLLGIREMTGEEDCE